MFSSKQTVVKTLYRVLDIVKRLVFNKEHRAEFRSKTTTFQSVTQSTKGSVSRLTTTQQQKIQTKLRAFFLAESPSEVKVDLYIKLEPEADNSVMATLRYVSHYVRERVHVAKIKFDPNQSIDINNFQFTYI